MRAPNTSSGAAEFPKLSFRCVPQSADWDMWVTEMSQCADLRSIWRQAGIDDAVTASASAVVLDRHVLDALLQFWSPDTSSFLLPFAEASFTLEDAHALSALPLSGSHLHRDLSPSEDDLRLRLLVEREKIVELHPAALRSRRVSCSVWLRWFLDLAEEPQLRHLGFLAYWLARDVIPPSPRGEIPARAFAIAARISTGDRIALAQIATANINLDFDIDYNVQTPSVPDKRSEVIIIDSEEESADFEEDEDRRLVEELEEFVRCGLLTEWEPSSPEADKKSSGRDKTAKKSEDPYGSEAIRMYPRFFEFIPQNPHYKGLLSLGVGEDVRSDVYLAKWYRLVELMRLALKTSWDTNSLEIEKLMREARKLEQFGFNVRHLIARLKEPRARVERLEKARRRLEEAQRTEKEARDVKALSSHINEIESKLRSIEKKLDESRQAIGLIQQDKLKRPINMEYLKKEVEAAEENLRAMKRGCSVYEHQI